MALSAAQARAILASGRPLNDRQRAQLQGIISLENEKQKQTQVPDEYKTPVNFTRQPESVKTANVSPDRTFADELRKRGNETYVGGRYGVGNLGTQASGIKSSNAALGRARATTAPDRQAIDRQGRMAGYLATGSLPASRAANRVVTGQTPLASALQGRATGAARGPIDNLVQRQATRGDQFTALGNRFALGQGFQGDAAQSAGAFAAGGGTGVAPLLQAAAAGQAPSEAEAVLNQSIDQSIQAAQAQAAAQGTPAAFRAAQQQAAQLNASRSAELARLRAQEQATARGQAAEFQATNQQVASEQEIAANQARLAGLEIGGGLRQQQVGLAADAQAQAAQQAAGLTSAGLAELGASERAGVATGADLVVAQRQADLSERGQALNEVQGARKAEQDLRELEVNQELETRRINDAAAAGELGRAGQEAQFAAQLREQRRQEADQLDLQQRSLELQRQLGLAGLENDVKVAQLTGDQQAAIARANRDAQARNNLINGLFQTGAAFFGLGE